MHEVSIYNFNCNNLCPDEIYSYLFLKEQNISNIDLHSISFKNCIIETVDFTKTLFANADFDSSHIENCIFNNQSFQNSDIISCNFKNCKFNKVSFKGSTMSNNTFEDCIFISCNFNHVTMNESTFTNCTIENITLRQSSTSLNIFDECQWINCQIHGNFIYNLLIESIFQRSILEEMVLSSNFGISNTNLISLGIEENELFEIQSKLFAKQELLNAAIIELNSNKNSYENSLVFCINLFLNQLQNNIIVRNEEIRFVELILSYLLGKNLIAPITIIQLLSLIDSFNKKGLDNIAIKKSQPNINVIYNTLFKAYQDYVEVLNEMLINTKPINSNVTIKLTFNEKPTLDTCTVLSSIQRELGINSEPPIQIKTEIGSFHEWITAPDNIIKCLQLLISIIGLCIKIKPKKSKNDSKDKEGNFEKPTISTKVSETQQNNIENNIILNIPDMISKQIGQVQTERDISSTINVFVINGMTIQNNYHGFNKQNLNNVECYYE